MAEAKSKTSGTTNTVSQNTSSQSVKREKRTDLVLQATVAAAKERIGREREQQSQQRTQQASQPTTQPVSNQPQQQNPKDTANETPNNEANQQTQAEDKTLNVAAETGNKNKELSKDPAERALQIRGILNTETLTPEEKAGYENELKNLEKEAQIETKTDVNDNPVKEGEKFSEGDIIKYLYGEFLKYLSEGWDYMDHFLIGAAQWTGGKLGQGANNIFGGIKQGFKNIGEGIKELDKNAKERAFDRDCNNAIRTLDKMYKKEAGFYQDRKDFAIGRLKDAATIGGIFAKGTSLEALDSQYEQLKGKKRLSKEEKKTLSFLERIVPEKDVANLGNHYLSTGQRNQKLQTNIFGLRSEYGPILSDLMMPREGETQAAFAQRFKTESLEKINSAMANCVTLCNMQQSAAYTAKLQAVAGCVGELKPEMTDDEKTAVVTGSYLANIAEIDKQVKDSFGDPVKDGISEEDLKRYDTFLDQRKEASTKISKENAKCIDKNHNLDDRRQALQTELGQMYSIGVPKAPEEVRRTEKKQEGIDSFAVSYNKQSPTEQLYKTTTEKLQILEQRKQKNAARKAQANGKAENTGQAPANTGKVVSAPLNNQGRE